MNDKDLKIWSVDLVLTPLEPVKGVTVGSRIAYDFYSTSYKDYEFVLAIPKKGKVESAKHLAIRQAELQKAFGKDVVFCFDNLLYYERERLAERGVYFLVPEKYFNLPFMMSKAIEAPSNYRQGNSLLPPAQRMLLWHLQASDLEGRSINEAGKICGLGQAASSRAVINLESSGLLNLRKADGRKILEFKLKGRDLWQEALPLLSSPVKKTYYCDSFDGAAYPICGINALSAYSDLNPDSEKMYALTVDEFKNESPKIRGLNEIDGDVIIEVWKYAPVVENGIGMVDKLSLYLSLQNDADPRVEKELSLIIERLWSKE